MDAISQVLGFLAVSRYTVSTVHGPPDPMRPLMG